MKLEVGMYVRTKNRTLQRPQIARIIKMSKDSGYKNQYYIELDKNLIPSYEYHIYEEDISKASFSLIDLIEVGDYVNGYKVSYKGNDYKPFVQCDYSVQEGTTNHYRFYEEAIYSIVTKEQFESMSYKVEV